MEAARTFLQDLVLVCGASAIVTVLFRRLGQPVVLGYLLAGILIGPHVPLPLFADSEHVHDLSELGVILVMFSIGLELSMARLVRVLPTAGVTGVLQIAGMMWLGYTAGAVLGWTWQESLFTGAMLSISSTVIVARVFAEQQVERRVASLAYGVLIVEDLVAVLLLAVLTAIATGQGISAGALAETTGRLALFLIAMLIAGFLLVPRAIRAVSRLGSPETLLVASVGLCFGLALLAQRLGYSVALGAFVAGSLIAESGRHRQVAQLIAPLRDLFAAVFFVSVGMMVDPAVILAEWPMILGLTALVIAGKIVFVGLGSFLSGMGVRTSIRAGMSLAHIGEFSFIMAGVGVASGATGSFLYPAAVAVAVITTFTTPWLVRASEPAARAVEGRLPAPLRTFVIFYERWLEALRARLLRRRSNARVRRWALMLVLDASVVAAIVVVASVAGPGLTEALARHLDAPPLLGKAAVVVAALVLALPFARGVLRRARNLGVVLAAGVVPPGPAGQLDLAATPRRALVLALQLGIIVLVGVPFLAIIQPFVPLVYALAALLAVMLAFAIALWRSSTDLAGHVRAGAELVLEVLSRQRAADEPASEDEHLASEQIDRLLPGLGPMVERRVAPGSPAAGRTLAELDLRGRTGAIVLAIARGEQGTVHPGGGDRLEAGDVVALFGNDEAIAAATELLGGADQSSDSSGRSA